MLRALRTAASGMTAQQLNIDIVAHNLANVNTTGFKKSSVDFEDLLYQTIRPAGPGEGGRKCPPHLQVGHGTKLVASPKVFSQGDTEATDNPLDLLIEGDGLFQVQLPDGTMGYTRDGALRIDGEGRVCDLQRPTPDSGDDDSRRDRVAPGDGEGRVFAREAGQETPTELGQFLLARFINPSGLESVGRQSDAAGPASERRPDHRCAGENWGSARCSKERLSGPMSMSSKR